MTCQNLSGLPYWPKRAPNSGTGVGIAQNAVTLLAWLVILFTGQMPLRTDLAKAYPDVNLNTNHVYTFEALLIAAVEYLTP